MKIQISANKNITLILITLLVAHSPLRYESQFILIVIGMVCFHRFLRARTSIYSTTTEYRDLFHYGVFTSKFYLFILLFTVIASTIQLSNLNNFSWGIFSALPFLLCAFIYLRSTLSQTLTCLVIFTYIELSTLLIQYSVAIYSYGTLNPFSSNQSAGDSFTGTLGSFSTPLSVSFFMILLVFINEAISNGNKKFLMHSIAAFVCAMLPGAASVFFIFFVAIGCSLLLLIIAMPSITKAASILSVLILAIIAFNWQSSNVSYGLRLLDRLDGHTIPFKALLYDRVYNSDEFPLTGLGFGNFNSRAGLIVSGEYLENQPSFIPITPSYHTRTYILDLYSKRNYGYEVSGFAGGSMVSEPFSQYLSIYTEGGIFALLVFLYIIARLLISGFTQKNIMMISFSAFIAGVLLTNCWIEYVEFSTTLFICLHYFSLNKQRYQNA